jgi:hypothetical protein
MNTIRNLEGIQADIMYLYKEKQGFFAGLFNSNQNRIKELRKEEQQSIQQWLYKANPEYKKTADSNIALLSNTRWKLQITDYMQAGRSMGDTTEITGMIETKGFLHGEGHVSYVFNFDRPSYSGSNIDALGKLKLYNVKNLLLPNMVPKAFNCITNAEGKVTVEHVDEEYRFLFNRAIIKSVIGDPFNGNSSKRKSFITTGNGL